MRNRAHQVESDRKEAHVTRRLYERYGLRVTPSQLLRIRDRILKGDCIPLCRQGDTVWIVELPYGGKRVILVFDAERGAFRTALPGRGDRTVEEYLNHLRQFFHW